MPQDNHQVLHDLLVSILGSGEVYFQTPSETAIQYPAIVYKLNGMKVQHANGRPYMGKNSYMVTFMTKDPTSPITQKLADLQLCRFDRHFVSKNLNHYVFTIYQ